MTSYHVNPHHTTARHIATMETKLAAAKTPPHGTSHAKIRYGASRWLAALRAFYDSIGKFFLWLIGSLPPETSAGSSGTIGNCIIGNAGFQVNSML